jgi:hypothetical protein
MDDSESLSHSKWECKYHVVFIPKCRRKSLYEQLRPHLGEVFRKLAKYKESSVEEGALDAGSRAHVDIDPAEVFGIAGGGVYQRQERDPFGPDVRGTQAQLCGAALLGERLFRINGRAR